MYYWPKKKSEILFFTLLLVGLIIISVHIKQHAIASQNNNLGWHHILANKHQELPTS